MFDLIIKNGTVIDGSGEKEPFKADIAIEGETISRIGFLGNADATTKIDAHGMYVTPGFIDILSHSDTYLTLFSFPGQESVVNQGVTTIIGGNCGFSLAPLVSGTVVGSTEQWTDPSQINIDWLRMSEYLARLKERKCAVNFGTLTGYNSLIKGVLKNDYRQPSRQENDIAAFLLEQSLAEGSFGLSLGLAYLYQDKHFVDHLENVFAVMRNSGRVVTVHLRDESNQFLDSLAVMLERAEEEKVRAHVSHLKVTGKPNWQNFRKAVGMIEQSAAHFDIFPYASSGLALYLLLPAWSKVGGPQMMTKRLQNSFDRKQIVKDLREQKLEYDKMTIASRAPDAVFVGKTVAEVARNLNLSGEETIMELLLGSYFQTIVFAHVLDEANIEMGIAHPLSLVASSGAGYRAYNMRPSGDLPHPRSFGTFPRFLKKYVRDRHLLTWKSAVAKITSQPAQLLGIRRRGTLKEGNFADIAVFDPREISDNATFENPYQYNKGMHAVVVNGIISFSAGTFTGLLAGKVLQPAS